MKGRVFRSGPDGNPPSGSLSWFAVRTDDLDALALHVRSADERDIKSHFANGDFEAWLRDLYKRPDLAEAVRRLRDAWNGDFTPRSELVAILETNLHRAS